jgi:hypothetical protein
MERRMIQVSLSPYPLLRWSSLVKGVDRQTVRKQPSET